MKTGKKNKKLNISIFLWLVVLGLITFMTMGYAYYGKLLTLQGVVNIPNYGTVSITSVTVADSLSVTENTPATTDGTSLNFDLTISGQTDEYYITYLVTILNDTVEDYVYVTTNINPSIVSVSGNNTATSEVEVIGIEDGDTIPSKQSVQVQLKLIFHPSDPNDTYTATGDTNVETDANNTGNLLGSITSARVGDLTGSNTVTSFTMDVINTFDSSKTFRVTIANTQNFIICNSSGGTLSDFTIAANSEDTYTFYIKKKPNGNFPNEIETVSLVLKSTGLPNCQLGVVQISVDTNVVVDNDAPYISNVQATINNTNGSVDVSWDAEDDSTITQFTVYAYNTNNTSTPAKTVTTNGDTNVTVTGLSAGTYYFVVVGKDSSNNTATQTEINNATTSRGHASKSNELACRWVFNVNSSGLQNMSSNGASTVNRGATYQATITADNNYTLPDDLTITMGGQTVQKGNNGYTFSNGTLRVFNVTGDLVISGSATQNTCLVAGTLIKTINGDKKIEDITYSDLLLVYNHISGKTTYEYPIWIEEGKKSNSYKKITFSDKTELKIVNSHSLFDANKKRYVDANKELTIGDEVYKLKNNKLVKVKVVKIESINEEVEYYNIVSTYFYNLFANSLLTTDTTSSISNIYGFKDNAIYGEGFNKINNGLKLEYEDISVIPYYLYKGLNLENALVLVNNGLDIDFLSNFTLNNTKKPINKNGYNYWHLNVNNKSYLLKEGTIYRLPKIKNIKAYYNTSDNNYYYPGDTIVINHGIYLESIYK